MLGVVLVGMSFAGNCDKLGIEENTRKFRDFRLELVRPYHCGTHEVSTGMQEVADRYRAPNQEASDRQIDDGEGDVAN
jgi:hypothetical protein